MREFILFSEDWFDEDIICDHVPKWYDNYLEFLLKLLEK